MVLEILLNLIMGCKCEFREECQKFYENNPICTSSYKRDRINQYCYQTMLETQPTREAERNQVPGTA